MLRGGESAMDSEQPQLRPHNGVVATLRNKYQQAQQQKEKENQRTRGDTYTSQNSGSFYTPQHSGGHVGAIYTPQHSGGHSSSSSSSSYLTPTSHQTSHNYTSQNSDRQHGGSFLSNSSPSSSHYSPQSSERHGGSFYTPQNSTGHQGSSYTSQNSGYHNPLSLSSPSIGSSKDKPPISPLPSKEHHFPSPPPSPSVSSAKDKEETSPPVLRRQNSKGMMASFLGRGKPMLIRPKSEAHINVMKSDGSDKKLKKITRVELKVETGYGDSKAKVTRIFEINTQVDDAIKEIAKRLPVPEDKVTVGLWVPAGTIPNKEGFWLEPKKKLADYDESIFEATLEMRTKGTLRGTSKKSERRETVTKKNTPPDIHSESKNSGIPAPQKFLKDPHAKLTIKETDHKSFALEFAYSQSGPDWTKPDKEGELLKQGSIVKSNWKPRWFVLQGHVLFTFKSKNRPAKDDEPYISVLLKGATVMKSDLNKPHSLVITLEDGVKLYLAAHTNEEFISWKEAVEAAIHKVRPTAMQKSSVMINFNPEKGYVGLTDEWKELLAACGITERQFYEKPTTTLHLLKFYDQNQRGAPIVSHRAPKSNPTVIDDIVTHNVHPEDLYEDFVLIGSGTFGEVYRAVNKRSGQKVAIKKMLLTPKREPLFISEINVQRNTEHPNVVKLFDAYKVGDHIWVVLEYMEGGNLYQVLSAFEESKLCLTEPQIAFIVTETLKALSYIHGMHRIHRDIKSDNILIGGDGEIKLADFGYAVQLSDEDEKRTTMAGSPYWMAPEIIEGEEYGKEVDTWSLGIMVMECCDLQPPYIFEPPSKALMLITSQPPPPLKNAEKWSSELKHFVSICLNRDPSKRPRSIDLLEHPFLRCVCTAAQFKEGVLMKNKKSKPCLIQ